jgi:hypothetical protein
MLSSTLPRLVGGYADAVGSSKKNLVKPVVAGVTRPAEKR